MPELPEVETVRRGISPLLEGRRIIRVTKRRDTLRIPIPDDFVSRIEGRLVEKVIRRAKYLLIHLEGDDIIICHLGMSGRITLIASADRDDSPYQKHDHVIFETDRGDLLIYNDPRRFGLMTLCRASDIDQHRFFKDMGPEPLGNAFNEESLAAKIAGRKSPIKNLLLDQRVVVGLGNIYVCEALFLSKISPEKKGNALRPKEIAKLVPLIRDVLTRAIEAGGSTLKDYARVDGELGYFQHSFAVYGREGEDCPTEDCTDQIARLVQSGRSTFYCPRCQG